PAPPHAHTLSLHDALPICRALDAAKGVARRLARPFISVPTIASTDAPASRGLVVYDDAHRPAVVEQLARNPEVVIVDTAVIAAADRKSTRLNSSHVKISYA